jgi:hypothetical protein
MTYIKYYCSTQTNKANKQSKQAKQTSKADKQSKQAKQTRKANNQSKQASKQTSKLAWVSTIIA